MLRNESKHVLLEHKRVPSDMLCYVFPGSSVSYMREVLGAPLTETERTYRHKFTNLYVKAESSGGATIDILTLVLPSVTEVSTPFRALCSIRREDQSTRWERSGWEMCSMKVRS